MQNRVFLVPVYSDNSQKDSMVECGKSILREIFKYREFLVNIFGEFPEETFPLSDDATYSDITDDSVRFFTSEGIGPIFSVIISGEKLTSIFIIKYYASLDVGDEVASMMEVLRKKY
ncbi:MAG: hypothetical protein Q7R99_01835 [bacterium]|nr:hypothetical protein [bacterium]